MNFVYISPNYPENHWMFCRGLKKHGAKVLAVVDTPYENLKPELKANVDEVYVVQNFNDYDQVYKALAYFAWKHGKIDWIESNNEAWLDLDARLRDDFHVTSGFSLDRIMEFQSKAAMKKYYKKAGVPTAPYCLPKTLEEAIAFASKNRFPMVLKPDHGVGASNTYRISNLHDLEEAWKKSEGMQMILEPFVNGDVVTLDGIVDGDGNIRFLASMGYVGNVMDSVQKQDSIGCYYMKEIPAQWQEIARRVVKAFGLKNRFFHGEYFLLTEDDRQMGPKGTLAGLEVNFRPPGGFAPDLMNWSNDMDVYDLWAQVLLKQTGQVSPGMKYTAGFAGRRNSVPYKHSEQDIRNMFGNELMDIQYLPPAFAHAMGDVAIKARFTEDARRNEFFTKALERKEA